MTPCFFGSRSRRLFGIYESAAPGGPGKRAAILCNPWGSEYIYAHRSLRRLASQLCIAGVHTLRFDYFGTGDSAGEMVDGSLSGWEADIETAMEELRDITGAPRVTLAGLRLGGALAARVAMRRTSDVDRLVMWDPIIAGAAFVRDLVPDKAGTASAPGQGDLTDTIFIQGFPLTRPMRADIQAIELEPILAVLPVPSLLLLSTIFEGPAVRPVLEGTVEVALIKGQVPWTEESSTSGVVPVSAIQRITDWLA